ncbi:MAG: ACP S-malonyltransferase [Desulfobacteraceae bacterium]
MKKVAFLFPGQGSQKVGMGQDLAREFKSADEIFAAADRISGLPIQKLCFEGPMEELTRTVNLQPAVTAVNLAFLSAIEQKGITPAVCAGHSLGEYGALRAAGIVSTQDCLKLVFKRGELMHREATRNSGAMSAIIGLEIDQVRMIVDEASQSGIVAVANHNSGQQIVLTGAPDAVAKAGELASAQGAKAIALKVSGAWHSPLISGAEADFKAFLDTIEFNAPQHPVIHNVTADTQSDPAKIRALMAEQLCSPVRWYDTITKLVADQIDVYVEIGPGRVLTGLLKKILPKEAPAKTYNVFDIKSLEKFIQNETC